MPSSSTASNEVQLPEDSEIQLPDFPSAMTQLTEVNPPGDCFADYITQSANDFLYQYSQNAYLDADFNILSSMDLNSGVEDFFQDA